MAMLPIRDRLPRRRVPIVNYLLIALNVLAFMWERAQIALGYPTRALLFDWGLVPAQIVRDPGGHALNVVTSMFMHDPTGWMHIGGNMLFLWIFGDNVEDALGRGRYLAFYLLSGLAAATLQVVIDPSSPVPMVGASGAIAGVLAAYGSLYPRSPIAVDFVPPLGLLLGFLIELPAWVLILEFFVVNLLNALGVLGGSAMGGVAFFAHIGGFIAGLFLVRIFLPRDAPRDHDRWEGFRRAPPRAYEGPYPVPPYPRERRRPWDD
jgi:membrane associated rhomboid family serine protease